MSQIFKSAIGGGGSGFLKSVTGNSGGAVFGDGSGNVNIVGAGAVSVTGNPGTNTQTISVVTDSFTWMDEAVSFNATPQFGYFCTGALTATLPASAGLANGATIIFYVDTASSVIIQANTGQQINIGSMLSSAAGTASSNSEGATLTLAFRVSDSNWHAISSLGTWSTT